MVGTRRWLWKGRQGCPPLTGKPRHDVRKPARVEVVVQEGRNRASMGRLMAGAGLTSRGVLPPPSRQGERVMDRRHGDDPAIGDRTIGAVDDGPVRGHIALCVVPRVRLRPPTGGLSCCLLVEHSVGVPTESRQRDGSALGELSLDDGQLSLPRQKIPQTSWERSHQQLPHGTG